MTLNEAIKAVQVKHPNLAARVVVELYPNRYNYQTGTYSLQGEIFAYQFMSESGRNIATYIPDLADFGGLTWQPGLDGLGRDYDPALVKHTKDLSDLREEPCSMTHEPGRRGNGSSL